MAPFIPEEVVWLIWGQVWELRQPIGVYASRSFFLDSGHTFVSCPHPNQPCQHNIPVPINDSPSTASASNIETDGIFVAHSALLDDPSNLICIDSAVPSTTSVHGRTEQLALIISHRQNPHITCMPDYTDSFIFTCNIL